MPSLHGLPRESTSIGHLVDPPSHRGRGCEECDSVATSAEVFADYGLCVWCAEERGLIEEPEGVTGA